MGMTNWSKAERLPMELRLGMANRLMDRVAYESIRVWLCGQGVETDEMPSDKAMRAYLETPEYAELRQQRLWAMPEFGGERDADGGLAGMNTPALFAKDGEPESRRDFLKRRLLGLQARMVTADAVQRRYDRVAEQADLCEGSLLNRVEDALKVDADDEDVPQHLSAAPWALSLVADGEEEPSELEELTNKGYLKSVAVAIRRSPLLMLASRMPETDPMWLSMHACRLARRELLRRDPRLLGPAAYLRTLRETLKVFDALSALDAEASAAPGGAKGTAVKSAAPAASIAAAPTSAAGAKVGGAEAGKTDSAGFSPHSAGFGPSGGRSPGLEQLDRILGFADGDLDDFEDFDDFDVDEEGLGDPSATADAGAGAGPGVGFAGGQSLPTLAEVDSLEASGFLPPSVAATMRAELRTLASAEASSAAWATAHGIL